MSSSDDELATYKCRFCEEVLTSSFYVCSKLHVACLNCCSSGGFCPKCHTIQVYCCGLKAYESSPKKPLFEKTGGRGPIISLPESGELEDQGILFDSPYQCCEIQQPRMYNCHDCGKLLSGAGLLEHYQHEHRKIHICPLPPGGCLSFRMKLDDVPPGRVKRLQILKLISHKQMFSFHNFEDMDNDKLLFIMATGVPYFESDTALLIWVASCYYGCSVTYSMEARGEKDNIASSMFTGSPIGPKEMEEITKGTKQCEELGRYLCVKDSLIKAFEKEGESVIINTLIHNIN